MIDLIDGKYFFQIDENAIPVFYINKATWTEEYKRIISLCAYNRKCYLIVEPDPQICNRYYEIYIVTRYRILFYFICKCSI